MESNTRGIGSETTGWVPYAANWAYYDEEDDIPSRTQDTPSSNYNKIDQDANLLPEPNTSSNLFIDCDPTASLSS